MYTVQGYAIGGIFGGFTYKDFETYEEAEEFFNKIVSWWCDAEIWYKGKLIKD
jgi:viroplasmin and RNaseH domain-containing protein